MRYQANTRRRRIEAESDALWQKLLIFIYNNKCAMCVKEALCNEQQPVAGHHILHRGYRWVRHDLLNGIPLCDTHHKWVHANEKVFRDKWLVAYTPVLHVHMLENIQAQRERLAGTIPTSHLLDVRAGLKQRSEELGI